MNLKELYEFYDLENVPPRIRMRFLLRRMGFDTNTEVKPNCRQNKGDYAALAKVERKFRESY